MTSFAQRLKNLAAINAARTYLEIGVQEGHTFLEIDLPVRVGVDPKFLFDWESKNKDGATQLFQKTSDKFFSRDIAGQEFDPIFLDGLHEFNQTFRDFCNSLARASNRTIWLIDDTRPNNYWQSLRSIRMSSLAQRAFFCRDNFWMGDVYKVIVAIRDFFPQFSYASFPGHSQTVVWFQQRVNFEPRFNSLSEIADLSFFTFSREAEVLLNTQDDSRIYELLNSAFRSGSSRLDG